MKIDIIASGSSGNCYRVSDDETTIMIECGIGIRGIQLGFDFELSKVKGCLISHEHKDHCKTIEKIIKKGINCYMSEGTAKEIGSKSHRIKTITHYEMFQIGSFKIMPFDTMHDAAQPTGFVINSGKENLLFATDTYYIKNKFKNLTHIMIECNYSENILEENVKNGKVSSYLEKRIKKSHFEFKNVKKFLLANDIEKVEAIYLIHISDNNGNEKLFKEEIQKLTGKPVFV